MTLIDSDQNPIKTDSECLRLKLCTVKVYIVERITQTEKV